MKYEHRGRCARRLSGIAALALLASLTSGCRVAMWAGEKELSLSVPPEQATKPETTPAPRAGTDTRSQVYLDMG